MSVDQVAILIFSCASIRALSTGRHVTGFILGLCGSPFWIWSSVRDANWGILVVSCWFTYAHISGIYHHRKIRGILAAEGAGPADRLQSAVAADPPIEKKGGRPC